MTTTTGANKGTGINGLTALDTAVASLLRAASADWDSARADLGYGTSGEWPPDGEHEVILTDITTSTGEFIETGSSDRIPCVNVTFSYQWLKDPVGGVMASFTGERRQIVRSEVLKTDGARIRARIAMESLKGSLCHVLHVPPDQLPPITTALAQAIAKVKGSQTQLWVRITVQSRTYSGRDGKTRQARSEKIVGNMTDTGAPSEVPF